MTKRKLAILAIGVIIAVLLSSCGTEPPALWPWWTKADTIAVDNELTAWRDTINGYNVVRNQTYACTLSIALAPVDTLPRAAYTAQIRKVAHLYGFNYTLVERPVIAQYTFGRKNDSILTKDTFCYITYRDSANCITSLKFDSVWTVNFYPETTIILPDTIVTYRVSSVSKNYFDQQEQENNYQFQATRYLELKKDSAALNYRFKHLTGFGAYIPNNTTAPVISYIIISKSTGQTDTFRYSPRPDGKGLLNLRDKDALYTIDNGENLNLRVILSASNDQPYIFLSNSTQTITAKNFLPVTNNTATTNISITQNGLQHLYIEAIPASALFYPDSPWKTTIWALPVRVRP